MNKEFGGYLPLELAISKQDYYSDNNEFNVIRLNNGRATFYFAAKENKIKKIFLPYFTCDETKDPFEQLKVEIEYYFLDDELLPKNIEQGSQDYLFWTNYYGNASEKEGRIAAPAFRVPRASRRIG